MSWGDWAQFRRIEEVEATPAKTMIDVVGVVESVDPWTTIARKDGTDATKRSLVIRDQSNRSVELTLWGDYAMNPGEQLEAVGLGVHASFGGCGQGVQGCLLMRVGMPWLCTCACMHVQQGR